MPQLSRLSALPMFLRSNEFWGKHFAPKAQLRNITPFDDLRIATGCHRWKIDLKDVQVVELPKEQVAIVDIAQGILERGVWTKPSWFMEQHLASLFINQLGWKISNKSDGRSLSFVVKSNNVDVLFENALVTARWQVEVEDEDSAIKEIWDRQHSSEKGSPAEEEFFKDVLAPTLKFPLLDYLQLQPKLEELGLNPNDFTKQRCDFALDTGRGLKLVIEVDGSQHLGGVQNVLDVRRDNSLRNAGFKVWRISTDSSRNIDGCKAQLKELLRKNGGQYHWGVNQNIETKRSRELMSCVWGSTVAARIQYLLLEALRLGILPWENWWKVGFEEAETKISRIAIDDFRDWFGRLRKIYGFTRCPTIKVVSQRRFNTSNLVIDVSTIQPHRREVICNAPVAWTRPANNVAPLPERKFSESVRAKEVPSKDNLDGFAKDFARKKELIEGQHKIISRILMGEDVIGLLPTGGGKSLTYQLGGLLLGGLTVYVAPLKSLIQDQCERLVELGVDLVKDIVSGQTIAQREEARCTFKKGNLRYILIAPERFLSDDFRSDLQAFQALYGVVCQVVIDECHCVSEWGHEFRPAYLSLSRIARNRTARMKISAPIVALTGTASSIVLSDLQRELGIQSHNSIVRAAKLDRTNIDLKCVSISQNQKHTKLIELVGESLVNSNNADGILIFCRTIHGKSGVLGVSAAISGIVASDKFRFYCGESPKWNKYAALLLRRSADSISSQQVQGAVPAWALASNHLAKWDNVKIEVQRDFIDKYQVLIATHGFGMGIDKESVRTVIHFMTPPSPEAYYQEVGRAGRDMKPARAVLLFSDEDANITDKILNPSISISESRQIWKDFQDANPWKGGDFISTFYFHQNTFQGQDKEILNITKLLSIIRNKLEANQSIILKYAADNLDKDIEYAIVRLIYLGVVSDYTKNYSAKTFSLSMVEEWEICRNDPQKLSVYFSEHYSKFVARYQIRPDSRVSTILSGTSIETVEFASSTAIVEYVYEEIEKKRRIAFRTMLGLARIGVIDDEKFKKELMLYLNVSEKFFQALDDLAKNDEFLAWKALIERAITTDELKELHYACLRSLASYPNHHGLLSVAAITRISPTDSDLMLSEQDFTKCLNQTEKDYGIELSKKNGNEVIYYAHKYDEKLFDKLRSVFGKWLIDKGYKEEAFIRFIECEAVRKVFLSDRIRYVLNLIPSLGRE